MVACGFDLGRGHIKDFRNKLPIVSLLSTQYFWLGIDHPVVRINGTTASPSRGDGSTAEDIVASQNHWDFTFNLNKIV